MISKIDISPSIRKMYRRKLPALFLATAGILLCLLFCQGNQPSAFDKACQSYLQDTLAGNTLNLHYTLAHPEAYGIESDTVSLPPLTVPESSSSRSSDSKESISGDSAFSGTLSKNSDSKDSHSMPAAPNNSNASASDLIVTEKEGNLLPAPFDAVSSESLTASQQYLLDLFQERASKEALLEKYPYYDNPLAPHSGQQVTLLTLLSEYQFYDREDVTDYLTLLTLVPDYLESLVTYTKEKMEVGLSPGRESLLEAAEACSDFFSLQDLLLEKNFLQESFHKHLVEVQDTFQLTPEEMKSYTLQHNRLCMNILLPAYEKLSNDITSLATCASSLHGLADYPEGQSYYRTLFSYRTGSSMTVPEAKLLLTNELTNSITRCRTLLKTHPVFLEADFVQNTADAFPLHTPEEMLHALQRRCAKDFPALPAAVVEHMHLDLEEVSPSLRSSSAPAFYLLPPSDFYDRNVIYMNPSSATSSYKLFTTLAHEGYPGHLYQTVASYAAPVSTLEATFHSLLNYSGFQEGYALYCELLSYDYAAEYYAAAGLSDMEEYIFYEKENQRLQLCLLTLLEIMIHDENADLPRIVETLSSFGIVNEEQVASIYEYIAAEPCCYTKYFISFLEIEKLQQEAKQLWGENYSDMRFHSFLLQYGPADFDTLHGFLSSEVSRRLLFSEANHELLPLRIQP